MADSTINGLTEVTTLAANDQFVVWATSANGTRKVKGENLDKLIFRQRTTSGATGTTLGAKQMFLLSYVNGVPVIEVATYDSLIGNAVFDGSNLSAGAVTYDKLASNIRYNPWVEKTANWNASAGDRILADTSGGAFTITLPASPAVGDTIILTDIASAWSITGKNLVVNPSGKDINNAAGNLICDVSGEVVLRYEGATHGWRAFAYGY
jgi:hypothetical protein